ncbi:alpha-ketoacid dehydrogenase subunit beta [Acidobacteria bacterium AH-259-O06]|nr:alpha-ketoacid dehydrogenase subunit beta [Acidobacteria bacterium AH-259-O06]MDA2938565.1 alpha-ketoacid dehydrogenase subunit beta [Acidobacteria bacterium AH-259-A15]
MPTMNIIQAVNDALRTEMRRDDRVVILGEDVGKFGGVFRATQGLFEEFGPNRVLDTPLAEAGIIGSAIGMALYGLRPVPEIQFADFIYPAFDQIVNEASKMRYRSGGQYACPMVIRTPCGGGIRGGHYHSQSPEAYFIHTPGLKVVMPSNPSDAKGLLSASIRDDNPVIFLEPKRLYRAARGEVPEGEYVVELGKAKVVREGDDVTIVTYGAVVHTTLQAAEKAAEEDGISVEIIDLRTLLPYDIDTILISVMKTGRVLIAHEAAKMCGFGAELSATLNEKALLHLQAPILRVTGFDIPFPYTFEHEYLPNEKRLRKALQDSINF